MHLKPDMLIFKRKGSSFQDSGLFTYVKKIQDIHFSVAANNMRTYKFVFFSISIYTLIFFYAL